MIGTEIGAYRILEQIGQGGMGVVYRGIDTGLDRPVAIKVLAPELAVNAELVERFRQEARVQARLIHTNIATLFAFLQSAGQCVIVMEFLEGQTLEQLLESRGKIPWRGAVTLARQALLGLGFAHAQGIVHRDIKPSNLALTNSGILKILDFGLAKALGGQKITTTGQRMGTVRYMSPEQIRGETVDRATDIYSLGITLYELLTGQAPFVADSEFDVMSAHVHTPAPGFLDREPDIPAGIEECVLKALAKKRADRFQSAEDFSEALEAASRPDAPPDVPLVKKAGKKRIVEPATTAPPSIREPAPEDASESPLTEPQPQAPAASDAATRATLAKRKQQLLDEQHILTREILARWLNSRGRGGEEWEELQLRSEEVREELAEIAKQEKAHGER